MWSLLANLSIFVVMLTLPQAVRFSHAQAKGAGPTDVSGILTSIFGGEDIPPVPVSKPDGQEHECGINRANELAIGERVELGYPLYGQYPWIISVRMLRASGQTSFHYCDASLINHRWAITTGSCVTKNGGVNLKTLVLRLGEYDFRKNTESYPHLDVKSSKVVIHPDFNKSQSSIADNDLALVRFAESVKFKKNISPVCLPTAASVDKTFDGQVGQFVGWGDNQQCKKDLCKVLQNFTLPIISNEVCTELTDYERAPSELCAGQVLPKREYPTKKFEGGSLTINNDGRAMLVGVYSANFNCEEHCKPLVFTRISQFVPWISQVMAKD